TDRCGGQVAIRDSGSWVETWPCAGFIPSSLRCRSKRLRWVWHRRIQCMPSC
ncbi:hypothetical protein KXV73_006614, partial [Aspergillus fumigatus]